MKTTLKTILAGAVIVMPSAALADEASDFAVHESALRSGFGVSTVLGGGITGFTNKTMRDSIASNVGGLWDLRVTIGSHTPIAFDIAYLGSAATIDALSGPESGTLVGTTVEGAVRYNVFPHKPWTPYAFAGIGWQRYDITGADLTLSDSGMRESDDAVVFPLGAGVAYRDKSGLVLDLRGTFRPVASADLVLDTIGSNKFASLHTWGASGAIGYEF